MVKQQMNVNNLHHQLLNHKSRFFLFLLIISGLWITGNQRQSLAQDSPQELVSICENWRDAETPEAALEACNKALEIGESGVWASKGDLLFLGLNNNLEALGAYNESVARDQLNSQVWTRRCKVLVNLARFDDAIDSCEKALRVDQNWGEVSPAMVFNYQGEALARVGRLEEAFYSYENATQRNPDYGLAWLNQCRLFSILGQSSPTYSQAVSSYDQALQFCDRSLASNQYWEDASASVALTQKGKILKTLKRYDLALDSFNRALSLDPQNPTAYSEYGRLLDILGKYGEASAAHSQAVKLAENYSLALVNQCYNLNALGKYEDGLKACEKAILEGDGRWGDEGIGFAWNQQGVALTGLQRYEEALGALNRAIGINAQDDGAWTNKSVAFWYMGRYDEALSSASRATTINPNSTLAWFNFGRIYTTMGQFDLALGAYDQALRGDLYLEDSSLFSTIHVNKSAVLWRLERYGESIEEANNAITIKPDLADAWYNRGLSHLAIRNYRQGVLDFQDAISMDQTNANYWAGHGIALRYLGQYEQSLASLSKALELNPTHPQAMANKTEVELLLVRLNQQQQSTPVLPPPPLR